MKRIVIMGATSGIGLELAVRLILKGHQVGIAGRNTAVLKKLHKKFPDRVVWEKIDITEADAPKHLHTLINRLGGMDSYVHVSGVLHVNPELDTEADIKTVKTNVEGFTRMLDTAYAYFRDNKLAGHIAAVTSVAGTRGIGVMAAYSASKAFGQRYIEALRQLAYAQGVKVRFTDIRPGWIKTPLIDKDKHYPMSMTTDYAVTRMMRGLRSRLPIDYIDWRWGIAATLMKLVPPCLWARMNITAGK